MPFELLTEYLNASAAVVLVIRLFYLKLFSVYRTFGVLVAFEIVSSVGVLVVPWNESGLDYRYAWLTIISVSCVLSVCLVYAMLRDLMIQHQGILSMSLRVSIVCFGLAAVIAALSARVEFTLLGLDKHPLNLAFWVNLSFVVERAFCTVSLLLLALMLMYLLWFPVKVPRNVAMLSAGLLVYFAAKTVLILARDIWSPSSLRVVSGIIMLIFSACLIFWVWCLTPEGQYATVQPGHSWKPADQERLMQQLEALNSALLRSRQSPKVPMS